MSMLSRYIMPKRGNLMNLKNLDMTHHGELIYVTNMNLFGIINSKQEVQFLVEIRGFPTKKDFPKADEIKENSILYRDLDSTKIYFFDLIDKDYYPIELNTNTFSYQYKIKE